MVKDRASLGARPWVDLELDDGPIDRKDGTQHRACEARHVVLAAVTALDHLAALGEVDELGALGAVELLDRQRRDRDVGTLERMFELEDVERLVVFERLGERLHVLRTQRLELEARQDRIGS